MADYQIYQLILTLIVFVILTSIFATFVVWIIKLNIKLIKNGAEDEKITTEYKKQQAKKPSLFGKIVDKVVIVLCCGVLFVAFGFSVIVSANDGKVCSDLPALSVVQSDSMSFVSEDNKYSYGKNYTDQLQIFDLILTYELPAESELKVGDIVVYQQNDLMIVHRIVAIEEPNKNHSERYFVLQGDANKSADMFPVRYSQMKSIYRGDRIPFVGSFVNFMQSPAGLLCVVLVLFAMISLPIADKKLKKVTTDRLIAIGVINSPDQQVVEDESRQTDQQVEQNIVLTDEQSEHVDLIDNTLAMQTVAFVENANEQEITSDQGEKQSEQSLFAKFSQTKTFAQKLEESTGLLKARYESLTKYLDCIKKVSARQSKKCLTYRRGRVPVAKLVIRGKTLNLYLSLDPQKFVGTKYKYQDVSNSRAYKNFAMRIKISSDRQVKWAKELVDKLVSQKGLSFVDKD